jgi:geranylgeranyl pyrophosphate synthase
MSGPVSVADIARTFLNAGGKRLRPRLCAEVFCALSGRDEKAIAPILEAVECFHKASLIHDDIQDGSESRYGRPALWKSHGVPVAVAVGDWLVACGYASVSACGLANAAELLAACTRSHLRLCEGQGDELLGSADYLSICERKTGEAFALAAELGALAAGADPASYRAWGLVYGTLFQINDDIADGRVKQGLMALKADYEARLKALPVGPFLG